ncbi:4-(cytidine 5'-diphospho)-2-C-methyl-D-erythritol kinase [Luteolibacter yonseiensis]|uniref:4-diphosphocytidyl-2-C-methyl-D-erythritol kinase n=1 Tax=Luteolibacter yonseiensis TaxID=1144680 RepID=A0A934R2E2_9BACT|nr:4-(cytidine 5'-diphospho)-2-C-methyl-D-erythritol kinase [Luteolibacter yonseiensis]MBK1815192.1 4-(cytidine 5'-diphospho)-2-C-methyl-D-erythritol kinase [Luteolibacter yonseiensis]
MTPFTLQAPAKLNLSLRILGKREDGFHEIDTLMVKLPGLADTLEFGESDEFSFSCDDPTVPGDEGNLVVKAARAYEAAAGISCRCSISLRKRVPHGAGLGGGSSDAAAALLGINRLHGFKLGVEALHEAAASLGSDIPFFLTSGASRCTGRGEIITPVPQPPVLPVLLLKPAFSVPTPDAYKRWKQSFQVSGISYSQQEVQGVVLENDLERPVFEKHRFLAEVKQWLLDRDETHAAMMSGSGSTVFAVLKDPADAESLAAAARSTLDPGLWHWAGVTEG